MMQEGNERYIRVEGEQDLYRDNMSNAIVNTNFKEYEAYKNRARQKNKLNRVEEELKELKSILKQLLKEKEGN
tara:strand:+ start:241 stop:459 length:219 start_codon:yes stop_codon:yes gene_type:complete